MNSIPFIPDKYTDLGDVNSSGLTSGDVFYWNGTSFVRTATSTFIRTVLDDSDAATVRTTVGAVGLTGTETVAGVKSFTSAPIINLSDAHLNFRDTTGTWDTVDGRMSFSWGLNSTHSVMGWGPNFHLAHAGPTNIDGVNGAAGWVIESNYITGGKTYHETYWTDNASRRVIFAQLNETDGTAATIYSGRVLLDGSAAGMRADNTQGVLAVTDNVTAITGAVSITIKNTNSTSKAVQLKLGGGTSDATGWSLHEDQARDGTHGFAIRNEVSGGLPIRINSSDRVGIGYAIGDSLPATALSVNGALTLVTPLSAASGGTGIANNAAATLTRSGNHALTITTTGTTGVTLPTSGTLIASGSDPSFNTVSFPPIVTPSAPGSGVRTYANEDGSFTVLDPDGFGFVLDSTSLNAMRSFTLPDASGTLMLTSAIGSTVQAYDADLASWAGVTRASGFDTFAATPSSANLDALVTDDTGSGALVFATSPTLVTPVLGVASATSLAVESLKDSSSNTILDFSATSTLGSAVSWTNSKSGTASIAAFKLSGVPFAGTGTTSFPLFYINDANATASTVLNTAGTYLGVNGDGTQDLMNLLTDGVSKFKVSSTGAVTFSGAGDLLFAADNVISIGSSGANRPRNIFASNAVQVAAGGNIGFTSGTLVQQVSNGILQLSNNATSGFTRLIFARTTSSGAAIGFDAVNGFTLQSAAGTATWNDESTAASGTVTNRYLFGIAAPTLTATNATTINTVASTVYIGGAPVTGDDLTISTAYALFVDAGTTRLDGGILGTITNDSATAGNIGEYISASVVQGSATALTTATPKTVTSISLTAGDWDVTGIGALTGASTGTVFDVAIGTTTNSFTGTVLGDTRLQTPTVSLTGADASLMVPAIRVSISATTTYYLIVAETFTIGTPAAYGRLSARRTR